MVKDGWSEILRPETLPPSRPLSKSDLEGISLTEQRTRPGRQNGTNNRP